VCNITCALMYVHLFLYQVATGTDSDSNIKAYPNLHKDELMQNPQFMGSFQAKWQQAQRDFPHHWAPLNGE